MRTPEEVVHRYRLQLAAQLKDLIESGEFTAGDFLGDVIMSLTNCVGPTTYDSDATTSDRR